MWRRVALVRTDVSEEFIASIIRVERINDLETTLALTNCCQLLLTLFLARRFLSPWWWRRYVPLISRSLQELNGVITQKAAFFRFKLNLLCSMHWYPDCLLVSFFLTTILYAFLRSPSCSIQYRRKVYMFKPTSMIAQSRTHMISNLKFVFPDVCFWQKAGICYHNFLP
jgi:hypothetical protein